MHFHHAKVAVITGLAMFFWGMFSWMVLPWHMTTAEQFSDEDRVASVLREEGKAGAGVYFLPYKIEDEKTAKAAAFVNLRPDGMTGSMGMMMILGLVFNVIIACFMCYLVDLAGMRSFMERWRFVGQLGTLIALSSHVPMWIWFEFPLSYTAVNVVDTIALWTLAGAIIGKLSMRGKALAS